MWGGMGSVHVTGALRRGGGERHSHARGGGCVSSEQGDEGCGHKPRTEGHHRTLGGGGKGPLGASGCVWGVLSGLHPGPQTSGL